MKTMSLCLLSVLVIGTAGGAGAEGLPQFIRGDRQQVITGGPADPAKATRDTVLIMGPWGTGAPFNGQFQNPTGGPAWNGWTHRDLTQPTGTSWRISDYAAGNLGLAPAPGNLAAWCGDADFAACNASDLEGGYGNNWNEILEWRGTVADPLAAVDVRLTAYANSDSEAGYDGTSVHYLAADGPREAAYLDGVLANHFLDLQFRLEPDDYQGTGGDEVVIRFNFQSDGAWSDADCQYPSAGALQVDDITVTLDQGTPVVSFTDFDGGWGDWAPALVPGVGDFAQLGTILQDLDPCVINATPQAAFIDDGLVVPGVGPSLCIDWCYGPGGYIVNTTGGRLGPDGHLHNVIESPVMPWPDQAKDGAVLAFTQYVHEDLSADAPGMFNVWAVRSTASADPEDILLEAWADRQFVIYGGPWYSRSSNAVSDLLVPGRRFVQIQLGVLELGYVWGWDGNDGYPAPYYDNVRLSCYDQVGPGLAARVIDLAQDNFPAIGEVDLANLGNNSVRFDMANTSSLPVDQANVPGDSVVLDIVPLRVGAELVGVPQLHWVLRPNPVFDPYRTSSYGAAVSGVAAGYPATTASGPIPGRWAFDLPDSNFLFPGDVLHYFVSAADDDGVQVQQAVIPADTTGFGDFHGLLAYDQDFIVRALPTVTASPFDPGECLTPRILFWNDSAGRGGENEWLHALANLSLTQGRDYDRYDTHGPSSGVGNGLGGRATAYSLAGYDILLYTSGDLGVATLSNGDFDQDGGNDLEVLDSWLRFGDRRAFFTGDNLVSDLVLNAGTAGTRFVQDWLKVSYLAGDLRPLINNQTAPLVKAITGNGVFLDAETWLAYGGCPGINTFDAVMADEAAGGVRLAEFLDPSGGTGAYTLAAATAYQDAATGCRIVTLPNDFMSIHTDPDAAKVWASLPARAILLDHVLGYFGLDAQAIEPAPAGPGAAAFALSSYPNPFNPATRIAFNLPREGRLSLKVYDLKGQLVRTLIDEARPEGPGHVSWDGSDDRGARLGSGVFFAEARTAGQVKVQKLVMVK